MKKITLLALLLLGYMGIAQISETGTPIGQPIPATGTTGNMTPSVASVSEAITLGPTFDISVNLDLNHSWDSDLDITLVSPAGTTLDLSSDNGGAGDNYTNTVFQDGAPSITTGSAPFTGTFQPEGGTFAATFNGENAQGDWTLEIFDDTGGDSGMLNNFVINFNSNTTQIIGPGDITVDAAAAACGAIVNYDVFAADDMGNVLPFTVTSGFASGAEFPLGTTAVTVSATDDGGTTVTDTFNVTVNEVGEPALECADITVTLDDMGMASITAADILTNEVVLMTQADGAGLPAVVDFGIDAVATHDVTLTGAVGTDFDIQNVTIDINHTFDGDINITLESPMGTTLDLSSGNGGSGNNYTNTVFEDGAPSITTGSAPFTGTFQPEGGTFAAAFAGEQVNGDWTITVVDTFGDGGTFNSSSIEFSPIGTPPTVVPSGCTSTAVATLDVTDFGCNDIGLNAVTVSATDGGVTTTCTVMVNVVPILDTTGPVDIFTGTGAGDESCATVVTYDEPVSTAVGCTTSLDIQLTAGLASGEAFPVGVTTVEYTTFDDAGNELGVYSFDVTISDTTAPALDCPDDLVVGADDDGNYTIEDYTAAITDNCTAAADLVSTQDPAPGTVVTEGSVTTVTVTSTDEAGNVTECTFDITVDSTLGTDDVALNNNITLFPNPTNGTITLRNGGNQVLTQISIVDANGRMVLNRNLDNAGTDTAISLSNLASGVYFARINSETASTVRRIVKQ